MPPEIEIGKTDDAFDDVMAAYREVSDKAGADAPDPAPRAATTTETLAETSTERRGPAKDERGRFAKKAPETAEKPVQADKAGADADESEDETEAPAPQETAQKPQNETQTAGGPPPSWSVKSKAAWDNLPADVRADIAKREGEVKQGLSALRDYQDLKPYAEMAGKQGTTIKKALDNYVGIENVLRQDLGKGLSLIAQNYGLDQAKAAQLFAQLAAQLGGGQGSPSGYGGNGAAPLQNGHGGGQPQPNDPLYNVLKPFIDPLNQQLTQLQGKLTSREEADRNASQQSLGKAIETFSVKPENRYFPDLEETITRLFETGMVPLTGNHDGDLRTAYDLAAQMVPEVRDALIEQRITAQRDAERQKEQDEAAKARKASRSLTGSRVPGTVTQQPPSAKGHDDIEADVLAAYRLHAQH